MKKILFKQLITHIFFFLILNSYYFISACSGSSCGKDKTIIPQEILEKGNILIISKTGDEFFNKYIQPDLTLSTALPSGYFLVYNFYMPEKPYVNGTIRFSADSTGRILTDREIAGIPNCSQSPDDCEFIIDEKRALEIANLNGLDSGIKAWDKKFLWNAVYDKYVWQIINTLQENEGGYGKRANGIEMIIDSNSGEVLAKNEWRVN